MDKYFFNIESNIYFAAVYMLETDTNHYQTIGTGMLAGDIDAYD